MNYIEKLKALLQKPFPDTENRVYVFKMLLLLCVFVSIFLYVFQPFGISEIESSKFLICLGFGSMTLVGALVYELVITLPLNKLGLRKNWTFGKWLINNIGLTFFISMANFLFIRLAFFGYILWEFFPNMLYSTFMIGLIPFSIWGAFSLIRNERKYENIATEINQKKSLADYTKKEGSEKDLFSFSSEDIRYVEALQNYLKIGYISSDGDFKEHIERTTLKNFLQEATGTSIVKCHRSFLVNRQSIVETSGNSQGLLLSLSDCPKAIPVSRSFVPAFR